MYQGDSPSEFVGLSLLFIPEFVGLSPLFTLFISAGDVLNYRRKTQGLSLKGPHAVHRMSGESRSS